MADAALRSGRGGAVFQASRLQRGLPLYVDPAVGAWEMGPPPSRYYVLYTPLWPWILAHVSPATLLGVRTVGRALNGLLFLATLGAVVHAARPENRRVVLTGALLAVGLAMLVREAGTADADMAAVALSTLGLLRMNRRRGLDALSAVLLAVAPLVKPSVLGTPVGAVLAHVVTHGKNGWRRVLVPLLAGGVVAGRSRGSFTCGATGSGSATSCARRGRRSASIGGSRRWAVASCSSACRTSSPASTPRGAALRCWRRSLSPRASPGRSSRWRSTGAAPSTGSSRRWPRSSRWARASRRPATSRWAAGLGWAGLVLALAVGGTSLPQLLDAAREEERWNAVVEHLRAHCTLRPGEVIVSSDSTLELELDGRIIVPSWQTSYLVRNGKFPLDAWRRNLARPDGARWFVHSEDYLEPPPDRVEGITEVSAFRKELRDVMEAAFVYDTEIDGMLVYGRR